MSKFVTFLKTKFPTFMFWLGKKKCLLSTFFYRGNPVKWTLKKYKKRFGLTLNLVQPTSFFEKINYIKHFYFDEKETLLSDKYRVKQFLTDSGDGEVVPKALFCADNVKDLKKWISMNKSNIKQFVIKTNHSCGDIFIYKNGTITRKYGIKLKSINSVYRMLKIAMKYNHYYTCFESNYRFIKPLVFVEEYIEMKDAVEYELMTNYGQIKFVNVVQQRQSEEKTELLYDSSWRPMGGNTKPITVPSNLKYMEQFVEKYASSFPFCRVDFIQNGSNFYFCEFTFIKSGGIGSFGKDELNKEIGNLIDISKLLAE